MKKAEQEIVDPELGRLLTTRRRAAFFSLLVALLIPVGVLVFLGGSVSLFSPTRPGSAPNYGFGLTMMFVGALFLFGAGVALIKARTKLWFYELGAARTVGKSRIVIPYAHASAFVMNLSHQFVNGIYAGTSLQLRLRTSDGRAIKFDGAYKVKARGLFKRTYEIRDDLEGIREAISQQMADVLMERMLAGEPIDWCGRATLTPTALTPLRGAAKGMAVPYSSIDRQAMDTSTLSLFRPTDVRAFVTFPCGGTNFWPCYALFLRLADLQFAVEVPASAEDEDEYDDD